MGRSVEWRATPGRIFSSVGCTAGGAAGVEAESPAEREGKLGVLGTEGSPGDVVIGKVHLSDSHNGILNNSLENTSSSKAGQHWAADLKSMSESTKLLAPLGEYRKMSIASEPRAREREVSMMLIPWHRKSSRALSGWFLIYDESKKKRIGISGRRCW